MMQAVYQTENLQNPGITAVGAVQAAGGATAAVPAAALIPAPISKHLKMPLTIR